MKYITTTLKTLIASVMLVAAVAFPAAAADPKQALCEGSGGTWSADGGCASPDDQPQLVSTFKTISDLLLFIIGAVAVIMIIIGGIRYITSNGDQAQVTGAKNTIMYAVIGIVVALLAYAIVNFVTLNIQEPTGSGTINDGGGGGGGGGPEFE